MPRLHKNETMRFDLPDDPDHGWIEVRHLEEGEIQEIAALSYPSVTRYPRLPGDQGVNPVTETAYDPIVEREQYVVRSITAWGNFFDADGREMPCNPASRKVWARDPEFVRFLGDCRKKLADFVREKREQARKN